MVIETKNSDKLNLPVGEKVEKRLWLHEDFSCGHDQEIPVDAEEVECGGFGEVVVLNEELIPTNPETENRKQVDLFTGEVVDFNVAQRSKSVVNTDFKTLVLKNRRNWDSLFKDFHTMKAITYVSSADFIISQFEEYGYEKIELVIGEGLSTNVKADLATDNASIDRLFEYISSSNLKILTTKATVHTKLYMLSNDEFTRVIVGSPNLSYNARGTRQREYAVYWDLYHYSSNDMLVLDKFKDDYNQTCNEPDIIEFMSDLQKLCSENKETDRMELYQLWQRNKSDGESIAIKAIFDNIKGQAFDISEDDSDEVIRISIPEVIKTGKKKFLTNVLGAKISGNSATITRSKYLNHTTMLGTLPMKINQQTGEIKFGIAGEIVKVPQTYETELLNSSLNDIERYIQTVDRATCVHPDAAKMTMMETIMYSMAAPFVNMLHKEKMKVTQRVNRRGPRHLLIYGPGHNGKTALGRYLNYLLTGKLIEPISAKQWNKKNWEGLFVNAQTAGTSFPIIIDDIKDNCFSGKRATLEGFVKSHWEEDWVNGSEFPVLIMNTNHEDLPDWAKTRIKRLVFNVKFNGGPEDTKLLNDLMGRENIVFAAFSKEYISQLTKGFEYDEDELKLARIVMTELYKKAGRDIPEFFPHKSPELIYDMDAISCYDKRRFMMFQEKKIKGGIRLTFTSFKSLNNFKAKLPPEINYETDDKTLVITNRDQYKKFMARGKPAKKSRLFWRK